MELGEADAVLKQSQLGIDRLSSITGRGLSAQEKSECSFAVSVLEVVLRKLDEMELYIDGNLERSRQALVGSTKTFIERFQRLGADDRINNNPETTCRALNQLQQSEPSTPLIPLKTLKSGDNPLYGGREAAGTAVFRIPNILKQVHLQCKAWDTPTPCQVTPIVTAKVKWVCEHLYWTSQFVDLIDKIAVDDDLRRLPNNVLGPNPLVLLDILRILKKLPKTYKPFVEQDLPCARNIQTKLEFLRRRKARYQSWLDGRKVHFNVLT